MFIDVHIGELYVKCIQQGIALLNRDLSGCVDITLKSACLCCM